MKNLPIEYWQQDYETIPSFSQRYWVQRCLELLDADTSHLFSLESVNSAMLLEELVNTSPNRPDRKKFDGSNARTFHFLLSELQNCISSDVAFKKFCHQHFPSSFDYEEVKRIVDDGVQKSSSLFDEYGRSLKGENSSEITAKLFAKWLQQFGMAQGASEGLMRQLHEHISINNRENWLKIHHETFLKILQKL